MSCPFCHMDNRCSVSEEGPCWCFTMIIPDGMLELLSDQDKGKTCVCQACIERYNDDADKFTRLYRVDLNLMISNDN
ncbi:cysteine-rich CWC family protein [Marinomonas sp. 5E14-1]|uniref:cysteine-rich CWC family protein n=1 Tax=Marinomonas sp. 5E14-1 TaxID=3153922 RepID=UPI0032649B1F